MIFNLLRNIVSKDQKSTFQIFQKTEPEAGIPIFMRIWEPENS